MSKKLSRLNPALETILTAPYPFDVVNGNKKKADAKFPKGYVIDFGVGDPTDPIPPVVIKRFQSAAEELKCSGYPVATGVKDFVDAVIGYVKRRYNVTLDASEICATYGAKYAAFRIPGFFVNPREKQYCIMPNPGYPPYADGTTFAGGIPYYMNICEETGFQPDVSSIPSDVAKNTRIFFLNTPHSPSGRIVTLEKMREVTQFCLEHDIILVSDECYSDLYFQEPPRSILEVAESKDCAIVLNSLSKRSMMTSCAVGFLASRNPDLVGPFKAISRKSVQGVANLIQAGAAAAYNDDAHCEEMRAIYKERLDALLPALRQMGCEPVETQGTFFVWVKVPKGATSLGFAEKLLLEKGINCVPGNVISATFNKVNPGDGYVRFALVPQIEQIREAAARMTK